MRTLKNNIQGLKKKKKQAIRPWKGVNGPSVHTAEWKKPVCKGYIRYNSTSMTLQKKQDIP